MFLIEEFAGGIKYRVSLGKMYYANNISEIYKILEIDGWEPDHLKNNNDKITLLRWKKHDRSLEAKEISHLFEVSVHCADKIYLKQ